MRTPRQAKASRQNGARSNGPVSAAGKARSSENATTHGILSRNVTAADSPERQAEFAALLEGLRIAIAPSGALEGALVERIAGVLWRTGKIASIEAGAVLASVPTALQATLTALERLELSPRDRLILEKGDRLMSSLPHTPTLDIVCRYEAHLSRELSRLLEQLQAARRLTAINTEVAGYVSQSNTG